MACCSWRTGSPTPSAAARAAAALDGRDYVVPDDVQALAGPVLAHRLLLTADAQVSRRTAVDVVADLVERTPLPPTRGR